jgi:uncharacterized membrane protein
MLTIATLGMAAYGLYSLSSGLLDLLWTSELALIPNLSAILLGAMLTLAGVFSRVRLPGSLALALAALFGLQSLALHNALHLYGQVAAEPQVARALFGAVLVASAYLGGKKEDFLKADSQTQDSPEL